MNAAAVDLTEMGHVFNYGTNPAAPDSSCLLTIKVGDAMRIYDHAVYTTTKDGLDVQKTIDADDTDACAGVDTVMYVQPCHHFGITYLSNSDLGWATKRNTFTEPANLNPNGVIREAKFYYAANGGLWYKFGMYDMCCSATVG